MTDPRKTEPEPPDVPSDPGPEVSVEAIQDLESRDDDADAVRGGRGPKGWQTDQGS